MNSDNSLGEREVGDLTIRQSDAAPATVIENRLNTQSRQVLQPLRNAWEGIQVEAQASLVSPETGLGMLCKTRRAFSQVYVYLCAFLSYFYAR